MLRGSLVVPTLLALLASSSCAFLTQRTSFQRQSTQIRARNYNRENDIVRAFKVGATAVVLTLGTAGPVLASVGTPPTVVSSYDRVSRSSLLTATSTSSFERELVLASRSSILVSTAAPPSTTNVAKAGITISDIRYDGAVPKTEADEFIVITNTSKSPVDVSKYYVYVATTGTQGATFSFPKDSVVKAGASVRVYTNEIHKETGGYSFGSGKAIWSNNGGLGVLKDGNGKKLAEYKYKPATK